jgi:hypothetical protein
MFRSPLTNGLTPEQRNNSFWVAEDDHCVFLLKGHSPAEVVARFSLNCAIEVIRTEAEKLLSQEKAREIQK